MKGIVLVCFVLCLATATSLVSATNEALDLSSQELGSYEQQVAGGLSKHLIELDQTLRIRLPGNTDPIANMKVVKELLTGVSAINISKKMALKMVAKLDEAMNNCSHKSYKVFAKNHIANAAARRDHRKAGNTEALRTEIMLDFSLKIHSQRCIAEERKLFQLKLSHVDEKNLQRVEGAFREIGRYDYHYDGIASPFPDSERKQFLAMRLDELTGSPAPRATEKITRNLYEMVRETDEWESLKPRVGGKSVISRPPKRIFDEFLFKPCAEYEQVLGENLNHARLDAMAEEEGKQFLADQERFYRAMIHSRICKQILEEQSKLYKVLADKWVITVGDLYLPRQF